ncbi:hypothetical protein F2Q70_00029257 [Brassica cretica]|uniref:Uncharacterized protein n=1 Tax=Brassica cretica TaxID=69181 RepID=A0A8S9FGG7_BRACR|nr:hypothetical protein F2Q70_00029257 [Brassica cretica]
MKCCVLASGTRVDTPGLDFVTWMLSFDSDLFLLVVEEIGHEASRRRLLAVTFPTFLFIPATSIDASGGYCSEDKL